MPPRPRGAGGRAARAPDDDGRAPRGLRASRRLRRVDARRRGLRLDAAGRARRGSRSPASSDVLLRRRVHPGSLTQDAAAGRARPLPRLQGADRAPPRPRRRLSARPRVQRQLPDALQAPEAAREGDEAAPAAARRCRGRAGAGSGPRPCAGCAAGSRAGRRHGRRRARGARRAPPAARSSTARGTASAELLAQIGKRGAAGNGEPAALGLGDEPVPVELLPGGADHRDRVGDPAEGRQRTPGGAVDAGEQQLVGGTGRARGDTGQLHRHRGVPELVVAGRLPEGEPVQVDVAAVRPGKAERVVDLGPGRGSSWSGDQPAARQRLDRLAGALDRHQHVDVVHRPHADVAVGEERQRGALGDQRLDPGRLEHARSPRRRA